LILPQNLEPPNMKKPPIGKMPILNLPEYLKPSNTENPPIGKEGKYCGIVLSGKILPITRKSIKNLNPRDFFKLNLKEENKESIGETVKQHFSFTLEVCPRKNKGQILSDQDFQKLVDIVSYFFENDYRLPEIKETIKSVNTTKQNIFYSFIHIFNKLKKEGQNRPDNLFELIKLLFEPYKADKISNIKKTKEPQYYQELIK